MTQSTTVTAMFIQGSPGPEIKRELQQAAEEIRRELSQIKIGQRRDITVQQVPPATTGPTHPTPPVVVSDGGPEPGQTVIGVPAVPFDPNHMIPPEAVDISLAFFFTVAAIIIGLPIARAIARWMDRKSAPAQIPGGVSAQLTQLTNAVDAIALEVERISEGQRFTTRLLSEQRDAARHSLPAGSDR